MDLKNTLNKMREKDRREKSLKEKSSQKNPYSRTAKLGPKALEVGL